MSDQTPKWRIYRLSARDSNGPPELFDAYRADDVDAEIEQWKLDYAIAVASRDAEIARLGGKPGEVGGGTGEGDAPDRPDRQTYMQADSTTLAERNEAVKAVASLSTRYVTLAARCEALEQQRNQALFDADERDALLARCEALTAERDRLAVAICPSGSVVDVVGLEALAQAHRIDSEGVDEYLDTGDETNLSGAYHAGAQAIRSRCQHLEQAIRVVLPNVESYDDACDAAVQALWAILESSDKAIPPTDENRVSFAAGYSAALDDALKGK